MKPSLLIFLLFLGIYAFAQEGNTKLVQFSGLVLTEDDNQPVPYATVKIKDSYRGTIANNQGFFSLVIKKTDTIVFSSVGFKRKLIFLPDDLTEKRFSSLVTMKKDTLTFNETVVYPWPSPAHFKEAFLTAEIDKDYYDLARENLSEQNMMRLYVNMKMDGSENQKLYLNQMAVRASYSGGQTNYAQFPGMNTPIPLSLLNPLAWAEFIKMLKDGGFKDKYKEYRN